MTARVDKVLAGHVAEVAICGLAMHAGTMSPSEIATRSYRVQLSEGSDDRQHLPSAMMTDVEVRQVGKRRGIRGDDRPASCRRCCRDQ